MRLRAEPKSDPEHTQSLKSFDARWRVWEYAIWVVLFLLPALIPSRGSMINEITIVALFAMSLDLILGFTGIVSLGHAAFFGFGAYTAGLFAKHIMPDPLLGLFVAIALTAVLGACASVTILRGTDLTRLMVTLGGSMLLLELANKLEWLTQGADGLQGVNMGPLLGLFEFDLMGHTAAWYSLTCTFLLFIGMRRLVRSPLGASLMAIRDNRLRSAAIGIPVISRLSVIYTVSAAIAGASGALLAQTTGFASLEMFSFDRSANVMLMLVIGGIGWLYGGIFGAIVLKLLQDWLSSVTPQYWMFWIGLILVLLVLIGKERLTEYRLWLKSLGKLKAMTGTNTNNTNNTTYSTVGETDPQSVQQEGPNCPSGAAGSGQL